MWNRYPLLFVAVLSFILLGCTKTFTLNSFPSGEVELASNLSFEFADSVAPYAAIGTWDTTAYLQFDPPLDGSFRWERNNLLTFWPAEGKLPASTKVVATPNPALFFGKSGKTSPANFEFHTPYFTAKNLLVSWPEGASGNGKEPIIIKFEFNYPVEPDEARKYIEVYRDGKKVEDISIYNYYATTDYEINADMAAYGHGEHPIELRIKPGLGSTLGHSPLAEELVLRDTLHPISVVEIQAVKEEFDAGSFKMRVTSNQGLEGANVATYITLVPNMPFDVHNEGSDLVITSDFRPGAMYTIGFREGMPGTSGGSLKKDFSISVTTPSLKPFLRFSDDKGHFLMRNGYENLNVKTVNLTSFTVELYEIYENNLLHFLSMNPSNFRRWSYWDTEEEYYYGGNNGYLSLEDFGALIHTDTIIVPKAAQNEIVDIPVKLKKQFRNKFQGIYAVQIRSNNADEGYYDDYKIVSLSDLGLIARWNDDDLLVFANQLSTALPAAGAKINLVSSTNQAYQTVIADAQGVARFEDVGEEWDYSRTFKLKMVTAQLGNDFQFLDFNHSEIDQDRFDLEGKSRSTYDIFCYSDRDLYRPGDTLHFSAIVRNWDFGTPKNLPLTIKVYGPEGGMIHEMQKSTNDDGSIELNYPIDDRVRTGNYRVDVMAGLEDYYGQYEFTVEEFVPDNIKVRLQATNPSGRPGDTLRFPLEAGYYFGSPCADSKYSVVYKMRYVDYQSAKFPTFDFAYHGEDYQEYDWATAEGYLDSIGRDTLEYVIPSDLKGTGLATGLAQATVEDMTGHTVTAQKTYSIATRDYFLGLREHGRYFNVGDNYELEYIPVDYGDNIAKGLKMEVKLVRFDWKRSMRKDNDGFFYVSENEAIVLKTDTIVQGSGINRFAMRITQAGNYELSITMLDGSGSQRTQFSAYGKSVVTESSFGVEREGTIAINFDKASYKVGENARILFTAPFSGRMLVTLERDKVYEYRYVDCQNNAAEVVFPIKEAHVPNIFITATLFRPQKGKGALPMTVAHGYGVIKVDHPSRVLPVKITAPDLIKPGGRQTITVQTALKPGVKVTVAVVDEGILAITHYHTPDAYTYMYEARELEVRGYDMYEFLLPEVPSAQGATGGSDTGDWSSYGQLNPVKTKRYRPFAWWSGILNTDGSGRVTVKVPIPAEFNGRARIMVMAYDGNQFGSGEKPMIIRENLIMMAAIPRFFTAGDSLQMPVNLINMTEQTGNAKVKLRVEGPLEIDGLASQDIEIKSQGTGLAGFGIRATKAGVAAIILETEGLEKLRQHIDISVRPPSPIITESGHGILAAGKSVSIPIPAGYEPEIQRTILTVSQFPALEFADELDYLLNYPYGCLEQTVSSVFPQLYFGDLAELIAPEKYKSSNAVHNVREGIEKLQSMQLYNGAFSYWPDGASYENRWGSVYATHFLIEARKAGFGVQEQVIDRAINHLQSMATEKTTFTYQFNRGGTWYHQEKASQEQIYALYVLSLAGKPDESLMNYYKSHPSRLCEDSRYLLAAAFAMKKDLTSFESLLPKAMPTDIPLRLSGGSFDSPMRATGIMLNTLVDADPGNPRIPGLIRFLRQNRKQLANTQEKAWAFLALGKIAKGQKLSDIKVEAKVNGQSILAFEGENTRHIASNLSGKTITLQATGKGEAYYYWKLQGIPKGATVKIADRDQRLKVRREWYNTDGRRIQNPVFNQGELVVCRVKVHSDITVENVAISDLIPAGFEVENTRLTNYDYSWIKNASASDVSNQDIRDDRVNIFSNFTANEDREFSYLVRAVNLGKYMMPPIGAEAMYDPEICSYHSGDIVHVVDRNFAIPGRTQIAHAKDSLKTGKPSSNETFANTEDDTIWKRFMRKYKP
jgi:alpha-2-macroglobulin